MLSDKLIRELRLMIRENAERETAARKLWSGGAFADAGISAATWEYVQQLESKLDQASNDIAALTVHYQAKIRTAEERLKSISIALRDLLAKSEAEGWAYSAEERETAQEALGRVEVLNPRMPGVEIRDVEKPAQIKCGATKGLPLAASGWKTAYVCELPQGHDGEHREGSILWKSE